MPAVLLNKSTAFLYSAHYFSPSILHGFWDIANAVSTVGTPWFLYQGEKSSLPKRQPASNLEIVTRQDITALNYRMPFEWIMPGSCYFTLFHFYQKHPNYSYYWLIEYDVRYSGKWHDLFMDFWDVDADYLTPHIRRYDQEPDWPYWELTHPTQSIPLAERIRCFHPIYRLSNRALAYLCSAQADGWCGHEEVLSTTLLYKNGFSIMDLGGEGEFVRPGMENKHYTSAKPNREGLLESGTIRYRPVFTKVGTEKNKLYHPVKPVNIKLKMRMALVSILGKKLTQNIIALRETFQKSK